MNLFVVCYLRGKFNSIWYRYYRQLDIVLIKIFVAWVAVMLNKLRILFKGL